jgi:hypothetical protein
MPRLLLRECECIDSGRFFLKFSIESRDLKPFLVGDNDDVGLGGASAHGANGGGRSFSNSGCLNSRGECDGVGRSLTPKADVFGRTGVWLTSPW